MVTVTLKSFDGDRKHVQDFSISHTKEPQQGSFMLTLLVNCGVHVPHESDGLEWKRHKFRVAPAGPKAPSGTSAIYTGDAFCALLRDTLNLPEGADPVAPELPGNIWTVSSLTMPSPPTTSRVNELVSRSCVSDGTTARTVDTKGEKLRGGIHMCAKLRETLNALPEAHRKCPKVKKVLDPKLTPDGCWLQTTPITALKGFAPKVWLTLHYHVKCRSGKSGPCD